MDVIQAAGVGIAAAALVTPAISWAVKAVHARELGAIQARQKAEAQTSSEFRTEVRDRFDRIDQRLDGLADRG